MKMERLPLSLPLLLSLFLLPTGQPQRDCYIMDDSSGGGHCHIWLGPTRCTVLLAPDACPGGIHLAVDQNSSTCNWIRSADGSSFAPLGFGDSSEHSWTGNTSSVFSHAQRNLTIICGRFPHPVEDKTVVFILSDSGGGGESTSTKPNFTNSSGSTKGTGPTFPPEKAATLPTDHPPHSPPIAKIVGGSVGGIFGIALVVVVTVGLAVWYIKKRNSDSTSTPETEQAEEGRSQVIVFEPAPSPGTLPPGAHYDIPQPTPNPLSRESSVDDSPFKESEQAQNESISDLATSSGRRSLPPPKGSSERDSVGNRKTTPVSMPSTASNGFNGGSDPVLVKTTVFSDGAYATSHEERGQHQSSVMA